MCDEAGDQRLGDSNRLWEAMPARAQVWGLKVMEAHQRVEAEASQDQTVLKEHSDKH